MRKQLLLLAIVAILAFAGVALAQDSHLASGSLVESESSADVAARAETFAEAEADLDAQMDAASDAENEVESDAESDEAAEADADSETDALTEENNTALLEVNDKSEAARHHHRHHWHWRPWWHHHRAAHQSHRKAHFHVDPHKGKRCVRWGHGRGYWKSFHGRTHKRSWLRRHFWGRHHHHRHHHHGRHHHHRHHHGHHRHHRHHWGHWFHRHHGHRHHGHRHHGHHHHRHHGHHHHRHHHHGGHHHHRHHGGGGGGHRHHHHHHHRGGGRRRFFLEMETEVQPAAASLVESAAERHHHHHHGHHHGHHHHGHHHHGHQQGAGRFWVPGPWKCIEWGEVPHPVDAPAPPAPVKRPWCEENVWMASSTHGYKVYYAAKCNKTPPADVVPAPKEPAKRASWCEEHADMKKGDNAGYYYHKCGGAPAPPKPKPLPPSVPKAPVEDREKWCKDFGYLRWTGNRPYYCSKCSPHCTAEKPATPPRPHGVPKAPKSKVERQNWCEQYNWMRWGRHSTYYYVKCGGAPPKAAPKAPEHVDHPPPKSERKPWCQEHNYFRYSKHYSAYFYEKCGGLVPATPQKKPKCPRWLPKIQEEHRAEFCHDYEWIKTNRKYRSCYCSKCSCPADALPAQRPANIPRPPPKRTERKAWCHEFHYLRFGSAQTYYCSRCGCRKPAKAKAPKDAPKVEGDLHKWCVANQRYRYYEASKGVSASSQWFYKLCGAAPLPLSSPPANIPKPPPRGQRTDWCAQYKSLEQTDSKNWYCHKCSCALPPPPPKFQPKLSPSFCDDNRYMTQTSKAAYYYSKCGGAPAKKPAVVKAAKTVNVAAPEPGTNQVHVHVNVAAPKTKKSNAGLKAMVSRVAKKNEEAAGKMDAILKKLKSQDCRDGNCLPKTHKEMAKWKADWILETEETGKTVP